MNICVPELGDLSDVPVIEVHVDTGDRVEPGSPLLTLETDKAVMEVPSPQAGEVRELRVKTGDKVNGGDIIATLIPVAVAVEAPRTSSIAADAAINIEAPENPQLSLTEPRDAPVELVRNDEAPRAAPAARMHAGPAARRAARELGISLVGMSGTGGRGRITVADVRTFARSALQKAQRDGAAATSLPQIRRVDFTRFGPIRRTPLERIRRISGARLYASWVNIPHVTQHDTVDVTDIEEFRIRERHTLEARGIKLTLLAFIVRACAIVLRRFPRFNSSLDPISSELILKDYIHIGVATDTTEGLLVPVVRDADRRDVYELASSFAALAPRARAGQLRAEELEGGSFTVSSLGGLGGTTNTPIINAPEAAILAVGKMRQQPVALDGQIVLRHMVPISLSYDHRIIDGADGARFVSSLGATLGSLSILTQAVP